MKALKPIKTLILWTVISSLLAAAGAYLAWFTACLYTPAAPLCRHDYGGAIVALLGLLLVIFPVAYTARARALRAAGRGMYARPVGGRAESVGNRLAGWVESATHFVIEGELAERVAGEERRGFHPILDIPPGYGWIVPLEDGRGVIVYWDDFREWLYECWDIQGKGGRQGATSQRTWDRRIGRDQTLARNHLLDVAGGLRRNRAATNATRRLQGAPWGILERLVETWPPEQI